MRSVDHPAPYLASLVDDSEEDHVERCHKLHASKAMHSKDIGLSVRGRTADRYCRIRSSVVSLVLVLCMFLLVCMCVFVCVGVVSCVVCDCR